jgi:ketosteroid isomerase-like protein
VVGSTRASLEEGLQRADATFFSALLEGDPVAVEALLAEDFVIVEAGTGSVYPRTAFVDAIREGIVTFDEIENYPDEAVIRSSTVGVGIVIGRTRMVLSGADGASFRADSRYTHVFRAHGDGWQLIAAQGTPITESR